jgi:hypothetical protein
VLGVVSDSTVLVSALFEDSSDLHATAALFTSAPQQSLVCQGCSLGDVRG